jgi:hypothetical protein
MIFGRMAFSGRFCQMTFSRMSQRRKTFRGMFQNMTFCRIKFIRMIVHRMTFSSIKRKLRIIICGRSSMTYGMITLFSEFNDYFSEFTDFF